MDQELTEQSVPEVPVFCPECGGEPVKTAEELRVEHRLGAMGYLHDDQVFECSDCAHEWTHGVPQGAFEGGGDLRCHSCRHDPGLEGDQFYRVHRVVSEQGDQVLLHLKCPRCYLFSKTKREQDNGGVALVGYPDITGSTEGADPYGWQDSPPTLEEPE